jgi:hypothetical protein
MAYTFKSTYHPACQAVARALTEFGYSGITADTIDKAHANWRAGKTPANIIERFAFDDFDKHPEHFGGKETDLDPATHPKPRDAK